MRLSQLLQQRVRLPVSDRRGSVSVLVALALPPLIVLMALGIDASDWAMQRVELQRVADLAAMAGAARYASTTDASAALAAAASVAAVNPVSGATVTPTFVSPASVSVTAQKSAGFLFAPSLIDSSTPPTISATAVADVSSRASGQACVLALKGIGTGVTTTDDIIVNGSPHVTLRNCDLRSNASMIFNGTPHVDVGSIVASGTILTNGSVDMTCPSGQSPCDQQSAGVQQIPDPFASTYGELLTMPAGRTNQPAGSSIPPPPANTAYRSLTFNATDASLQPGVYYVAGSVIINGNPTITGAGVTLVLGGSLIMNGTPTVTLSAPSSGSTAGLLVATTASSLTLNGNNTTTLAGAVYVPNGSITVNGSNSTASTCLVAVAQAVTFNGSDNFANSGCGALGVPPVYDLPPIARLVQ